MELEWSRLVLKDGRRSALLKCPECGEEASLEDHTIHPDGKVEPSVVCPYEDCSFHDFIQLDGWPEWAGA